MSEAMIIKIVFGSLLTCGSLALFIIAFKGFYKYLVQQKKCTSKVKGIVKKYTFAYRGGEDSGVHLPIVFYNVNGKEYKVVGPEYKKYIVCSRSGPLTENEMEFKEDDQILKINRTINSFVGIRNNPMQELYPVDSEVDVYYDPSNPKLSYVLRYCDRKWEFYLCFSAAVLLLIVNMIILIGI